MVKSRELPSWGTARMGVAIPLLRIVGTRLFAGAISSFDFRAVKVLRQRRWKILYHEHRRRCAKARSSCTDLEISQKLEIERSKDTGAIKP